MGVKTNKRSKGNFKRFSSLKHIDDPMTEGDSSMQRKYSVALNKLIIETMKTFSNFRSDKLENFIKKVLAEIGKTTQVERTCIALFSEDMSNITTKYEWVAQEQGIEPLIKHLQHIPTKQYPWFVEQILTKEEVLVPDIKKLPKEAAKEKAAWTKIGYKSLLLVPLKRHKQHIGFVCFDMFTRKKTWAPDDIEMLHVIADLISQALKQQDFFEAIQHRVKFEQFVSAISKEFASADPLQAGKIFDKLLKRIGQYVGVERTCISLFSEDMSNIKTEYEWVNKKQGIKSLIEHLQHISTKQYPWFVEQVLTKEEVLVPDIEKLPEEAAKEKAAWTKIGYKSLLLVPLKRHKQHIGFVCFDMFTRKKTWASNDIELLHVIADLISQALKQQEFFEAIQHRVKFEQFVSAISKEFASADPLQAGKIFDKLLKRIGQYVGVERTCISLFSEDMSNIKTEYEWVNKKQGIKSLIEHLQNIPTKQYPWFVEQVLTKEEVLVPDIEKLPKEAAKEKAAWIKIGYKSLLLVPLKRYKQHIGFVCFDMFTRKKTWAPDDIEMLHVIADLISQALKQQEFFEAIQHRVKFEQFVSAISKELASADPLQAGKIFDKLLKRIGQYVGIERTCISLFSEDMSNIKTEYEWVDKKQGIKSLIEHLQNIPTKQYPWFVEQVLTKEEVLVPDIEKLPEEAAKEKAAWIKIGYKSLLLVPLKRYKQHIGFVCFDMFTRKKTWAPDDIEMLHVIADLFSQFMARQLAISMLAEKEKRTYHTSRHDSLTDLPNRLALHETCASELSRAKRFNRVIAFLIFDVDFFKNINDTYGHDIGDLFLQEIAKRLKSFGRKEDFIARLGGDEFAIIITDVKTPSDIVRIAERLLELFKREFILGEYAIRSGISIGISTFPLAGETMKGLYKHADIALYQAKQSGRNCYKFFSEEYNKQFQQQVEIETALRGSIINGEMFLVYQPIVNMKTRKIIGAEALLRWQHPKKGTILPDSFISIAEASGLIVEIGKWVISQVHQQAITWGKNKKFRDFYLTMNLSPYQLYDEKTIQQIIGTKDKRKMNLQINLELTESDIINNIGSLASPIKFLIDHDFNLLVDDFGTGSSSLERMGDLPVSTLKIDRSFISGIPAKQKHCKIVKMIIALGKSLDLNLIAEGVETKQQMEFLLQNECNIAQGFYFYKPMQADQLTKIVEKDFAN